MLTPTNMYIAIDLGSTNTRVASSENLRTFHKVQKFPTIKELSEQKVALSEAIEAVSDNSELAGIALGIPGIVEQHKTPNYSALDKARYSQLLEPKYFQAPIYIHNDAQLAALGEAVFGAGQKYESVAYITLSTGIGGAKIEHKQLNPLQNVSEPGHHIMLATGRAETGTGIQGTFEAYCSGTAFKELYGEDPKTCTNTKLWHDYAGNLAIGLFNLVTFWHPQVVVLGGGMANNFSLFYDPLMQKLSAYKFLQLPPVVKAGLGDDSGLYGGFALLAQKD